MAKIETWSIGCDPGFKETGIVLMRHGDDGERHVQAWATLSCMSKGSHYKRTEALGLAVITQIETWCRRYRIDTLDFSIETPIYTGNPKTFSLQWRLIQEIEGMVASQVLTMRQLWLTEVGPTTAKAMATGNGKATKDMMVEAAPEEMFKEEMTPHTAETIADAWAHSLSTWGAGGKRIRINDKLPAVKQICEGAIE